MSQPWIKMRHNLQTNPNVIRFCDSTGMTPREAVGTLYDLWTWADQHTEDGWLKGIPRQWLCDFLGSELAVDSLVESGWLHIDDDGIQIVDFEKHNSDSAKRRAENSSRKQKSRARKPTVTRSRDTSAKPRHKKARPEESRGEERREEEKNPLVSSPTGRTEDDRFEEFWDVYPRKIAKKKTEAAWEKAITEAAPEEITAAAREFAKSPKARGKYCPHPATWLDSGRWEDDRKEWQVGSGDTSYKPPPPPTESQLKYRGVEMHLKELMKEGQGLSPEAEDLRRELDRLEKEERP